MNNKLFSIQVQKFYQACRRSVKKVFEVPERRETLSEISAAWFDKACVYAVFKRLTQKGLSFHYG